MMTKLLQCHMQVYNDSSVPVQEQLACISPTVRIDASGTVEEVYTQMRQAFIHRSKHVLQHAAHMA
jgi:hypothetical protein